MSDVDYVDTHCHLDHHWSATVSEQVERARAAGVRRLVTIGTDVGTSRQAVAAAESHDGVWAVVGIHPNDADQASNEALAQIDALARHERTVGVGETGLDRYRDATTPQEQEASFRAHIDLAKATDRTLVIHCRDAWEPCLEILEDQGAPERVVMHCFSGDRDVVAHCADRGWFMSFAGNVTFTNAEPLREAARTAPMGLLLTETDSPFLTPHPHRGEPNEPRMIPLVLETLAALHDRSVPEMAAQVWQNAERAFAFPSAEPGRD